MAHHRFFQRSRRKQYGIQGAIAIVALLLMAAAGMLSWVSQYYFLGIVSLWLVLSVVAPFFDTPSLKRQGKLVYHSPLFIAEREKNGVIEVHGGTLFDYVFVIDRKLTGRQRTLLIIQQYLEGLLHLIESSKHAHKSSVTIRGTSYIIGERTARKVGFTAVKTDSIRKLLLALNYLNLLLSTSIAKNRLSFPKLRNSKTWEASLAEVVANREDIHHLNSRLKRAIADYSS